MNSKECNFSFETIFERTSDEFRTNVIRPNDLPRSISGWVNLSSENWFSVAGVLLAPKNTNWFVKESLIAEVNTVMLVSSLSKRYPVKKKIKWQISAHSTLKLELQIVYSQPFVFCILLLNHSNTFKKCCISKGK